VKEKSQGSTPSDSARSQKPALAGDTFPRSHVESKAIPVRELHFSQSVRIPGYGGASNMVTTNPLPTASAAGTKVASIFLYQGEFCIDGEFFIPKTAGALLGWKF